MRDEPKICKYLDIPFQHISDSQLRSMRRGIDRAQTYALIDKLRSEIPGIALRTTLLTGYPDESEADFAELMEFVGRVRFERLGVFAYSEEEGTYSAQRLSDNVPEKTKRLRVERLMELQNGISRELNMQRLGTTERVIVDGREDGLARRAVAIRLAGGRYRNTDPYAAGARPGHHVHRKNNSGRRLRPVRHDLRRNIAARFLVFQ